MPVRCNLECVHLVLVAFSLVCSRGAERDLPSSESVLKFLFMRRKRPEA